MIKWLGYFIQCNLKKFKKLYFDILMHVLACLNILIMSTVKQIVDKSYIKVLFTLSNKEPSWLS